MHAYPRYLPRYPISNMKKPHRYDPDIWYLKSWCKSHLELSYRAIMQLLSWSIHRPPHIGLDICEFVQTLCMVFRLVLFALDCQGHLLSQGFITWFLRATVKTLFFQRLWLFVFFLFRLSFVANFQHHSVFAPLLFRIACKFERI